MHWMLLPYRRYAEFSGRSRRQEYWMFVLFNFLVSGALAIIFGQNQATGVGLQIGFSSNLTGTGGILQNLFGLVSFIPGLAVFVRRLHDTERSGWWTLLVFIPFFGWLVLLVFACLDGTRGINRFGPDPKDPTEASVFR
jgi:uncharacterized membrane protein YhaH (DUF805 family)